MQDWIFFSPFNGDVPCIFWWMMQIYNPAQYKNLNYILRKIIVSLFRKTSFLWWFLSLFKYIFVAQIMMIFMLCMSISWVWIMGINKEWHDTIVFVWNEMSGWINCLILCICLVFKYAHIHTNSWFNSIWTKDCHGNIFAYYLIDLKENKPRTAIFVIPKINTPITVH